jgi:flagellar biosynthesis/type III secretory pathway protein FliH
MMARPVAEYLMRFGKEADLPPPERIPEFAPIPQWSTEASPPQAEDHTEQIEAAREAGKAEGHEAAFAQFAEELETERQNHQEQLAAARQSWLEDEGERLRATLSASLTEIETRIAQSLSNVLMPFIADQLRKQMVAELVEKIYTLIGSDEAISIKITGPADLLDVLRAKLASERASISYEVSDGVDVSVKADQTTIETQLSTWLARLAGEME